MSPNVVLLGTCDTKLEELLHLRHVILRHTVNVTFIDVGRTPTQHDAITIGSRRLLQDYGDGKDVAGLPRGEIIKSMASCATTAVKKLFDEGSIHAIIAAGGSGGTSLAAEVMRNAVPIGFPKLIVSTVASGDTGPIVEETDITLMYSVVDVAGVNQVLRNVLSNAGAAIAGMAHAYTARSQDLSPATKKQRVAITMFGVTTPAVDAIRKHLESNYDIETFVFHATGHGGKAMERLIREGGIDAVLDLTTTEICDHLTGGVMSAGPHRLEAAAEAGIPNIISVGATDMTNFGPRSTVPERYRSRKLYEHNPVVTLMRTSRDEARQVGEFIAEKLQKHAKDANAIQVWLPTGGVSAIAVPDAPFADEEADAALFAAVKAGLSGSGVEVVEDKRAINDESFARDIAESLVAKMALFHTRFTLHSFTTIAMLRRTSLQLLALLSIGSQVAALDLDVSSQDSIKSAAKTLASGIVSFYKDSLTKTLTPGLFPKPYYWWEAGAVFHGLIEYSYLTGDSQYDTLISEALQWQVGESDAFMPLNQTKTLGNEDQSTWGLAAITAAEVGFPKPKNAEWVDYAANVFNTQVLRLQAEENESSCKGGLRWQIYTFNDGYEYKDTNSNGNFFLLAARLAKFTGNETYTHWADKSYTWAKEIGLITNDFAIYNGADAKKNCTNVNRIRWANTHGIYTEGAALMHNITNGAQNWTNAITGLVKASSTFQDNSTSALVEVACEKNGRCDIDQRAFKGIAARSFARAAISAPSVAESINKMIGASAKGAASACDGNDENVSCNLSWIHGESKWSVSAKDGNLGEVFGALEVVQALLYPQAKALATGNGKGSGSNAGNGTKSGGASGTSGAVSPQSTGSAGTIAASITAVIAVAFSVALSY
ncbi:glycoside hydrolase family 76 protein [Cucurbitaria berberidis CBS 394.84]|uniref:mannan endo-1,6-alpha-mannosidase n=1 Tax=Cucurbitaria berberidis CBS 394.84 TaxID=1168544 RepID=A0A9P4L403_9PLEO|nr:glycoside hydrolase family 76 protein [Cucurbitaria berberidis CBS 394.84]KAF1840353.1 glycoside hydrolase family 76 protein [Cucurbitaria berberidis CBS 394.84]